MSPGNLFRCLLAGPICLAMTAYPVAAQEEVGALYGTVTDADGGSLRGASLTLTGFGELKVQPADERGRFRFLGLAPGVWSLEARLDGFSTVHYPTIQIEASRSTTLVIEMSAEIQEAITVTAESPLLDERKLVTGTTLRQVELDKLPMARNPWAVLAQAPGVLISRVDVGDAESDQQAGFRAPGVSDTENDYVLDGTQIADNTSDQINNSPTYYDFDQFEELQVVTGGNDITKNTAGVTISLVTKRGSNEPRGSARFLLTESDGYFGALEQAESGFDPDDLGPGQDDFVGNSIDRLQEYGFEAGGPAWRNHLWLWGAWSQRNLSKIAANAEPELFVLESEAIKLNAQLSTANSLVASFNNTDKRAAGRGAGPNLDRSATSNQRGPTGITKLEDSHVFGSSFFVTGAYSYVDGGFELAALGGSGPDRPPIPGPGGEKNRDANGFVTNQFSGKTSNPHEQIKLDASYFLSAGGVAHELRFGGRLRETRRSSTFSYPGRNIIHYHRDAAFEIFITPGLLEMFGLSPARLPDAHLLYAYRGGSAAPSVVDSRSLWVQDTITWSRWTVNAGLRYDFEEGENRPATVEANLGFPEVMPSIEFEGNDGGGFTWETLSPRLGVTYAVGEERKTLLRASLSRFPESLVHGDIRRTNPVSGQLAAMVFLDEPGGFPAFYDDGETFAVLGGFFGFDPADPTALSSSNTTDPDYDPAILDELVVGVEHAFLPELVTGLNLTWRRNERIGEDRPLFRDSLTGEVRTVAADEYLFAGQISGELPDGTPYSWDRFAVPPHLQATGGDFLTDGDRSIESFSAAISFTKRLSNRWMARGFVNYVLEESWQVPDSYFDHNDPNRACSRGPFSTCDPKIDGEGLGGAQSRWQWNLNGMYQVAPERGWGFNVATNLTGRQGYPIVYTRGPFVVVENLTDFRYDDLFIADLRLEKEFAATSNTSLTFSIDAFNLFNDGTVLSRQTFLNFGTANWALETVSPRVFRLGVRLNWR